MIEKVAIFLDIENLAHWLKIDGGETLLERSSELGRVVVRRAYGDFSLASVSKRQSELNLLGFEFIHVYHPVKGKNSADIQIVVDVMEYLSRVPDLQWFVLATGDSDFSPLFRRLRELGKSVVGIGPTSNLSEVVKKSCNRFIYTDIIPSSSKSSEDKKELKEAYLDLIDKVLSRSSEEMSLSSLKMALLELDPSFDERLLGYSGFLSFLKSVPDIIQLEKKNTTWFAKSLEEENHEIKNNNSSPSNVNLKPSSDLYKRMLKKTGIRLCSVSLLDEIIQSLKSYFSDSFTQSEQLDFLFDKFDGCSSRGEIRAASYLLYKSGYINRQEENSQITSLCLNFSLSLEEIKKNIDIVIISRIYFQCYQKQIEFISALVVPLLFNHYQTEEIQKIVSKFEREKIEINF